MDIVDKINALRIERGWSVNYLAMEAMLTQSTVNNIFMRHTEPKISTLRSICSAFGITLAEFFAEETDEKDDELLRRVKTLSDKEKQALLILLRSKNKTDG